MEFAVETTDVAGVVIVTPPVFEDARGFFMETFREDEFARLGLPTDFVQDNQSRSSKGVLRGLHFQWNPPMAKLMRVTRGSAFLVAVDVRKGSPTLGRWIGVECSEENRKQVYAPAGCARGFCVLSDVADIQYKCTGLYNSRGESGIRWNDPEIGIEWPIATPILSAKDESARTLAAWLERPESNEFVWQPLAASAR